MQSARRARKRKGVDVPAGEPLADRLVEHWAALNLFRGVLPLSAAAVGLWASLG
jgi:hypothetical protein